MTPVPLSARQLSRGKVIITRIDICDSRSVDPGNENKVYVKGSFIVISVIRNVFTLKSLSLEFEFSFIFKYQIL